MHVPIVSLSSAQINYSPLVDMHKMYTLICRKFSMLHISTLQFMLKIMFEVKIVEYVRMSLIFCCKTIKTTNFVEHLYHVFRELS